MVVVAFAAVRHRAAVHGMEAGRRVEAESFARILQGLSRSVSAEAVVEAIVEELAAGTGADHIVIVRRRPESRVLEATLVNGLGGATSSTLFPIGDLEDPPDESRGAFRRGRRGEEDEAGPEPGGIDDAGSVAATASVGVAVGGPAPRLVEPVPAGVGGFASHARTLDDVPRGRRSGRRTPELPLPAPLRPMTAMSRSIHPGSHRPRSGASVDRVAERIERRAQAVFGLRNTLVAPLSTDEGQIGALVVSRRTSAPWPAAAQRILVGAAVEASTALARAYSHRAAEARASTDGLTGLPNRRYFDEFCSLLARRRRAEDDVGILMIDIDRFKGLNDRHGHQVGDDVLREVASAIAAAVREDDVPARYGGEEFVVLLRNPTATIALDIGERVRGAVADLDLRPLGVPRVSVSVGAAVAHEAGEPIETVIQRADRALYLAKRRGRDRVVAA
ncbi:MAG TPA: GGDEF domain-containing protein [Candidatus Limnocylindrales bacterium]|nr:GGDEF domain-containing protein [Candidatus Limnocylindrales bacterium]